MPAEASRCAVFLTEIINFRSYIVLTTCEVFSRDVATLAITFIRSEDHGNFEAFYAIWLLRWTDK
jgi:hypothetical protein